MNFRLLKIVLSGFIISASVLSYTATAGLISSWKLNGNADDSSGNSHDGSSFGATYVSDTSGSGYATSASFDGNDYIALNQSFSGAGSLGELSASAWFKTTATGSWVSNWALLDFDRSEFFNMFVTGDGEIGFSTRSGSINDMYSSVDGLNDGNWHHVAVTYSALEGKNIYIDGNLDSTIAYQGALGTAATRFGMIGDGSEASSFNGARNNVYYDGFISDVKLWDNALTASQVKAEVPEPSMLALFALGIMGLGFRRLKQQS